MIKKSKVLNNKLPFSSWIGIALSIVCLYLVFRKVNFIGLLSALKSVDLHLLILSIFFFLINLVIRAIRWDTILRPVKRASLIDLFSFIQIGYMANNLLPLRLGEFIRPYFLGEKIKASKSAVFATVVLERIFDVLSLLLLVFILAFLMAIPSQIKKSIVFVEIIFGTIFILFWMLNTKKRGQLHIKTPFLPEKINDKIISLINSFFQGLSSLTVNQAIKITFYSIITWAVSIASTYFALESCHIVLPWYASAFVLVVINLGLMIPSSPGYVGLFHYLAVVALTAFFVDKEIALTFAVIFHGIGFVLTTLLGLMFLIRENLSLWHLRRVILATQ